MSQVTPKEFQEKHARNLKNALEDVRLGVEKVTESPCAKAAANAAKMKANIVKSIDSGKWAAGLNRVPLADWKTAMIEKGVNRIPAGIDAAAAKVEAFAADLLPYVAKGQADLKKLPDVTLEDSINRMVQFTRHMSKFTRK